MAVFDESKVINALHTDKAEIGKRYWYTNFLADLKRDVEKYNDYGILEKINKSKDEPFYIESINIQFLYPYEEPKKKLVPFTWEDRNILRGKWIKHNSVPGIECIISGFFEDIDKNFLVSIGSAKGESIKAAQLLRNYTFIDGSPCGKEVEE